MFGPAAPATVGINLPWITYGCDFGANAWQPRGGLAERGVPETAARVFDALSNRGASIVRWFLFCDGRCGIRFDDDRPLGLDGYVFADIDAALAIARAHALRVVFVLFDFHWCRAPQRVDGVTLGGRRRSIVDTELRAALIQTVVEPVLARYGSHAAVAGWDIINEPEWVTFRLGTWNPFGTVGRETMRRFIDEVARCGRKVGAEPMTVGLASARWLPLVEGGDLDFYQVHWYDRVEDGRSLRPAGDIARDRPVVLGEFPTRGSARSPEQLAALAAAAGYAASWSWSALAGDAASDADAALRALDADIVARRQEPGDAEGAAVT